MKKIITFLALLFSLVGFAQYTLTLSDITYTLDGTNLTITDYTNTTEKDIIIPTSFADGVNTYTVTTIGEQAFYNNSLTSVTIPNTVTTIGNRAFIFNSLTSVTTPNSVITIGDAAFGANSLTSISLGNSIESMGHGAFSSNEITSVTMPNSVTSLGEGVFEQNKITSASISTSLTELPFATFRDNLITSVTIPSNIETLGDFAFLNNKLTEITIPDSVTNANLGDAVFANNLLTSFSIPTSYTSIPEGTFSQNLFTEVTIPSHITNIGVQAFSSCPSLTKVNFHDAITEIGQFAFGSCAITELTIPDSITSFGDYTFIINPITKITYLDSTPASYTAFMIGATFGADNSTVDLVIPAGSQAAFVTAGWTPFNYVSYYEYTGTGTDWHTASNWDQNSVPSAASDIIVIPTGKTVTTTSAVTFDTMTIAAGSTFIANATVTGDVTYQKALTSDWELVTAPLSGETVADYITNNTGLATGSTSGNTAFSYYDNNFGSSKYWNYYNATSNVIAGNLTSGSGFATKLSTAGNISLTGTLNASDVTSAVSIGTKKAYNLVGNPFTAYYSSSDFLSDNSTILAEQTLWIRSGSGYTAVNNANAQMLAPGQGFFVKANAAGSVSFKTANQSHSSSITPTASRPARGVVARAVNTTGNIDLALTSNDETIHTNIYFNEGTTTGFDNGWDSSTFGGLESGLNVYTELVSDNDGRQLAIQSLPDNDETIIPVGVNAEAGQEITFSAQTTNVEDLFLVDTKENKTIDITSEDYSVTLQENETNAERFYLQRSAASLNNDTFQAANYQVKVFKANSNQINITGFTGATSVSIINLAGEVIYTTSIDSEGNSLIDTPTLATGIYLVNVASATQNITNKINF